VALKEWAVTVDALNMGSQVLLLRKGGIREEGKEFKVLHHQFLLYPTYEHQREDLLKEPYRRNLQAVLAQGSDPEYIAFTHWAQTEEVIELSDEPALARLTPYHIWSEDYAQKRLHWKPRKPLFVMLLRVYQLLEPQRVAFTPRYAGCKSWVQLDSEVSLGRLLPVMSEGEFDSVVTRIRSVLVPSAISA
jgi:hypothetical protein